MCNAPSASSLGQFDDPFLPSETEKCRRSKPPCLYPSARQTLGCGLMPFSGGVRVTFCVGRSFITIFQDQVCCSILVRGVVTSRKPFFGMPPTGPACLSTQLRPFPHAWPVVCLHCPGVRLRPAPCICHFLTRHLMACGRGSFYTTCGSNNSRPFLARLCGCSGRTHRLCCSRTRQGMRARPLQPCAPIDG